MSVDVRPQRETVHVVTGEPSAASSGLRVTLLGGFELREGGSPVRLPPSAERLVAFLAIQNRPLHRAYVAGSLWPETTDERAAASLRSSLWRVRRRGQPLVEVAAPHLRLVEGVRVDVHEVMGLIWRVMDSSAYLSEIDLTILSTPAELLPGWYEDWVLVERERLRQLRLHALETQCERLTSMRRFGQAVEAGLAAVRDEPLRESAHRALIKAFLAEGNAGEALRQYRTYRQVLDEELGLVPSSEMDELVGPISARGDVDGRRTSLRNPGAR